MNRALIPASLALLALPAAASAHSATIACDQQRPGHYTVQPDYLHLQPVTTFGPEGATVRWRDGYTVTLSYPGGCVMQTPTAPENSPQPIAPPSADSPQPVGPAPQPPDAPQAIAAPPGDAPQAIEPQPRKRTTPSKPRKVTCALLNRVKAGPREYTKRGWYWRCKAPVARKVPFPGVTG